MRAASLILALLLAAGPLMAQPADLFRGEPGRMFLDAMTALRAAEATPPGPAQAALLDEVATRLQAIERQHPESPMARALSNGETVGQFSPNDFRRARLRAAGPEAVRSLLLEHAAANAGNDSYCRAVADTIAGRPTSLPASPEHPRLHRGQDPFLLPVVAILSRQAPQAAWRVVTLDPFPEEAFEVIAAGAHFLHDFGGTPPSFQTPFALLSLRSLQALAEVQGVRSIGSGLWFSPWGPPGDQRLDTAGVLHTMRAIALRDDVSFIDLLEALLVRRSSREAVLTSLRATLSSRRNASASRFFFWINFSRLGFWRDEDAPALRTLLEALAGFEREVASDPAESFFRLPVWMRRAVDRPSAARDEVIGWLLEQAPDGDWWHDAEVLDWALRFGWLTGPRVQAALLAGLHQQVQVLRLLADASEAQRTADQAQAQTLIAEASRRIETLRITSEAQAEVREGLRRSFEPMPPHLALLQGSRQDEGSLLHDAPRYLAPAASGAAIPVLIGKPIDQRRELARRLARGYLLVDRPGEAPKLVRAFEDPADRADLLARISIDHFALGRVSDALEAARQASREHQGASDRPPLPGVGLALAGDTAAAATWALAGPLATDCRALTLIAAAMASTR